MSDSRINSQATINHNGVMTISNVDIDQYPEKKDILIPNAQVKIRKGDLHANAITFLYFLIRQNILDLPKETYERLVSIYKKNVHELTKEDLDYFREALKNAEFKNPAILEIIGDELADRGSNDYFTLLIFKKLQQHQVETRILFSNHSAEAVSVFKKGIANVAPSSYREYDVVYHTLLDDTNFIGSGIKPKQDTSLQNMGVLIEKNLVGTEEVEDIIKSFYLPSLKLIDYTITEQGFTYSSHAPIGLMRGRQPDASIEELAEKFGVTFNAENTEALKQTIDQLNEQFKRALNGENPRFKDIDAVKKAANAAIWNRVFDKQGTPHYDLLNIPLTLADGTALFAVHGHDGGGQHPRTPSNVINLDNHLGKGLRHLGDYSIQITALAPPLQEDKLRAAERSDDSLTHETTHTLSEKEQQALEDQEIEVYVKAKEEQIVERERIGTALDQATKIMQEQIAQLEKYTKKTSFGVKKRRQHAVKTILQTLDQPPHQEKGWDGRLTLTALEARLTYLNNIIDNKNMLPHLHQHRTFSTKARGEDTSAIILLKQLRTQTQQVLEQQTAFASQEKIVRLSIPDITFKPEEWAAQLTRLSTTEKQPATIDHAKMKESDVTEFLNTVQNSMDTTNEPNDKALQQLLSNPNTREILEKNPALMQTFSELYTKSVAMIANSLIAIDKQMIDQLDAYEFFVETGKEPNPTISTMIQSFNKTSVFIRTDILNRETVAERTLALEHWLRVAEQSLHHDQIRSLNLVMAIQSVINSSEIHRLAATFAGLTPHAKEIMQQMNDLTANTNSSKNLRAYIENHPGTIPFIGIYLSDYIFLHDGNAYTKENTLQSFALAYGQNKTLRQYLQAVRDIDFNYQRATSIQQGIDSSIDNEEELYNISLTREPRGTAIEPATLLQQLNPYTKTNSASPALTQEKVNNKEVTLEKTLVILPENSTFLAFTQQFPNSHFAILSADNMTTMPEEILAEQRAYYHANPMALYTLAKYGKAMDVDLNILPQAARKKIQTEISKENFTDEYFEKIKPRLEQDYIARTVLNQYNQEHPEEPITYQNVILLDQYAKDVYANNRQHLLQGTGLMDAPSNQKMMAIAYTILTNPDFFKAADDSKNTEVVLTNRMEMTSHFLKEMTETDKHHLFQIQENRPYFQKSMATMQVYVDEIYSTEKVFQTNMLALVHAFYQEDGTLKPGAHFLKTGRNLTITEQVLLNKFLEPYRILAKNHLGERPDEMKDAISHFADIMQNDNDYREALEACAANQADFLAFGISLGGFKPLTNPVAGQAEIDVATLAIQPIQRAPRLVLLSNDLIKSKKFIDPSLDVLLEHTRQHAKELSEKVNLAVPSTAMDELKDNPAGLSKKIPEKTRQKQNAEIESAYLALLKQQNLNPAIIHLINEIKTYGLKQKSDGMGLLRANKVSEILIHLAKKAAPHERFTYLKDKLTHDHELHLHRSSLFEHEDTTLVKYLIHLEDQLLQQVQQTAATKSAAPTPMAPPPTDPLPTPPSSENHEPVMQTHQEEALLRAIASIDQMIALFNTLNLRLEANHHPYLFDHPEQQEGLETTEEQHKKKKITP